MVEEAALKNKDEIGMTNVFKRDFWNWNLDASVEKYQEKYLELLPEDKDEENKNGNEKTEVWFNVD